MGQAVGGELDFMVLIGSTEGRVATQGYINLRNHEDVN